MVDERLSLETLATYCKGTHYIPVQLLTDFNQYTVYVVCCYSTYSTPEYIREGSNIRFCQKDVNMTSGGEGVYRHDVFFLEIYA